MLAAFPVLWFSLFLSTDAVKLNVSLVVVGYIAPYAFPSLVYLGPTLSLATDHVRWKYRETINFDLKILYDPVHTTWDDLSGSLVDLVSKWHYCNRSESDITVYIIPSCPENSELPFFQTQWNNLWITTMSASPKIRNRQRYPTWIAMNGFSQTYCSDLYIEFLTMHNWTSVYVIVDITSPPFYKSLALMLTKMMESAGTFRFVVKNIDTKGVPFRAFEPILQQARTVSRVVLFFGHASYLRELMITAALMNMTNGEYVYIATESMRNKVLGLLHWQYNDSTDQVAFQAFQSLFVVHPRDLDHPPDHNLGQEFVKRSLMDYNFSYSLSDQPFFTLVDTYKAVTAFAYVLNESLTQGMIFTAQNGAVLAARFLNRTFTDDSGGGPVHIDNYGQRIKDFTVSYFTPNGTRQPFMQKIGTTQMLVQVVTLKTWGNGSFPPLNEPLCGYMGNSDCQPKRNNHQTYIITSAVAVVLFIGMFSLCCQRYIRRNAEERQLLASWWHVTPVKVPGTSRYKSGVSSFFSSVARTRTAFSAEDVISLENRDNPVSFGIYQRKPVMIVNICRRNYPITFKQLTGNIDFLRLMKKLYRMEHQNLATFFGLSISEPGECTISAVFECPSRGTFVDICNSFVTKDFAFTSSLIADYLDALEFIHCSPLHYHGRLSIMACWIDKHFTLKVMNVALDRLASAVCQASDNMKESNPNTAAESLYWLTPETPDASNAKSMQAVDIFSTGFIIYELLTKAALYAKFQTMSKSMQSNVTLCCSSIRRGVSEALVSHMSQHGSHPYLESVDFTSIHEFESLLRSCWYNDPNHRPSIRQFRGYIADISPQLTLESRRDNLIDKVYQRLYDYSADLEREVAARTSDLRAEMAKCDAITGQFLPRAIIRLMRAGQGVMAEIFDSVSHMFTDLFGFADFVKSNAPERTIQVIGETEASFDSLSTKYDVYKVEAVGDSYLVAGGLPIRIGHYHIKQIAAFSLHLMELEVELAVVNGLRFKIGIHSGPCAAGVLGIRRPRYSIFGDTINTASRMCSHGKPSRIHLSLAAKSLLGRFAEFVTEPRGMLRIKGKSDMMTYWLNGRRTA